jgi:hypothetical protein
MIKTPQELEVWYVIPAIRRELTKTMLAEGLTQKKAAQLLGVTEPAISQYLSSKRAKEVNFDRKTLSKIKAFAKKMVRNEENALEAVQQMCARVRKQKILCKVHRKKSKVPSNCDVCLK